MKETSIVLISIESKYIANSHRYESLIIISTEPHKAQKILVLSHTVPHVKPSYRMETVQVCIGRCGWVQVGPSQLSALVRVCEIVIMVMRPWWAHGVGCGGEGSDDSLICNVIASKATWMESPKGWHHCWHDHRSPPIQCFPSHVQWFNDMHTLIYSSTDHTLMIVLMVRSKISHTSKNCVSAFMCVRGLS